jgi:hypothetical protein
MAHASRQQLETIGNKEAVYNNLADWTLMHDGCRKLFVKQSSKRHGLLDIEMVRLRGRD